MPDERKAILLRLAPELWEEIARLAERELRSTNAQIEFMLREGLVKRGVVHDEARKNKRSGSTAPRDG